MPETSSLLLYLSAAFILAVTPGPGIFYVLTRSIKGGRREGYQSSFGTAIGGMFHVLVAALGLSAILATSALAFSLVKYIGAAYLIYLGIQILRKNETLELNESENGEQNNRAFYQGIVTEVLNPKTAIFFLAFIPQFINPDGIVVLQFVMLGTISVIMNTTADIIVASLAGPIASSLKKRPGFQKGQRIFSGMGLIGLGVYLAASGSSES